MPINVGILIGEHEPVRKLVEICDELDYVHAAEGRPHAERSACENRAISVSQTFSRQKREAEERIGTPEGILLRVNRSIQVEGAFGVIKEDYAFRRFLTRGKTKTETQFFLIAFAFNIRKLCLRIESGRFGKALFEAAAA